MSTIPCSGWTMPCAVSCRSCLGRSCVICTPAEPCPPRPRTPSFSTLVMAKRSNKHQKDKDREPCGRWSTFNKHHVFIFSFFFLFPFLFDAALFRVQLSFRAQMPALSIFGAGPVKPEPGAVDFGQRLRFLPMRVQARVTPQDDPALCPSPSKKLPEKRANDSPTPYQAKKRKDGIFF
jgi:hypothetical protein